MEPTNQPDADPVALPAPLAEEEVKEERVTFEEAKAFYERFNEDHQDQFRHPGRPGEEDEWVFLISYDPDQEYYLPVPMEVVSPETKTCRLSIAEEHHIEIYYEMGKPADEQTTYPITPARAEKLPLRQHDRVIQPAPARGLWSRLRRRLRSTSRNG